MPDTFCILVISTVTRRHINLINILIIKHYYILIQLICLWCTNLFKICKKICCIQHDIGPSWSWLYGCWIYNYICYQCLSPLKLWIRIPFRWGVLDPTLCDKVCQWLFSPGTLVSSINKADCHEITEILLKVALNTITLTPST